MIPDSTNSTFSTRFLSSDPLRFLLRLVQTANEVTVAFYFGVCVYEWILRWIQNLSSYDTTITSREEEKSMFVIFVFLLSIFLSQLFKNTWS